MQTWAFAVNLLFPVPLLFLLVLCVPLPLGISSFLRQVSIKILDVVLLNKFIGGFCLYHIAILASLVLFILTCIETGNIQGKLDAVSDRTESYVKEEKLKCLKWRGERNFWIALFSLVLWLILYRFHQIIKDLEKYKTELESKSK